jgi:hypothetical protein
VIRLDVEADARSCRADPDRRRHILHDKIDLTDLQQVGAAAGAATSRTDSQGKPSPQSIPVHQVP